MDYHKDVITTSGKLPKYLTELVETDADVILIHSRRTREDFEASYAEPSMSVLSDTSTSTINLTGTPLVVDLDVLPPVYRTPVKKWNQEESQLKPITLKLARKIINDYNKQKVTNSKAVYCLCDGTDVKKTVTVGCSNFNNLFTRTLVFAQECVDETYPQNNINSMMKAHIENTGRAASNCKVEVTVTAVYELYGYPLTRSSIVENSENNGSILLEGSWRTCEYDIPSCGASIRMILQVVLGHKNSVLHVFFEELVFLYKLLKMLNNRKNLNEMSVSSEPLDVTVLYKKITDILCEVNILRIPTMAKSNVHDAVENIKDVGFTDKLWRVLKNCGTVIDIGLCLNNLFDAVNNQFSKILILENDKNTMIGKMVADIYEGRMIVPNLSSKQSLELFIELGLQKMKRNYFYIVKSSDFSTAEQLSDKWNKIGFSLCETRRGTFAELNLSQGIGQLNFLLCMHVQLEFIQLLEENRLLSKNISATVFKCAYNKYMTEKSLAEVIFDNEIKQLQDLTVPFISINSKVVQDHSPAKWQIKMVTTEKNASVATKFSYSQKPVFPDAISSHEDTNTSSNLVEGKLYAAAVEIYSDQILSS